MSSILFTTARSAFLTDLFVILQQRAVAVANPSIVPMISEFFILLPPDSIVCIYAVCMRGKICQPYIAFFAVQNNAFER